MTEPAKPLAEAPIQASATPNGGPPKPLEVEPPFDWERTKIQIIEAVAGDAECRRRIDSWLATVLPDGLGVAGSLRNIWLMTGGAKGILTPYVGPQPTNPWYEAYKVLRDGPNDEFTSKVCTGIAGQSMTAIKAAMEAKKIGGLTTCDTITRTYNPIGVRCIHDATKVVAKDGKAWVFDWHATLNVRNPVIQPRDEWLKGDIAKGLAKPGEG